MRAWLATLLVTLALAAPAYAQPACGPDSAVVALSDIVLEKRRALPRAAAHRLGAEAAYLKLRYASLGEAEADALLNDLVVDEVRGIQELGFAWLVATKGFDGARTALGPGVTELMIESSPTVVRALVLGGGEDLLFDAVAAERPERQFPYAHAIEVALIDQPDSTKSRIARRAEELGLTDIAAVLFATHNDISAWPAFLERLGDPDRAAALTSRYWTLPALVGHPAMDGGAEGEALDLRRAFGDIFTADALQPEVGFLNTFINQTGLVEPARATAEAFITETFTLGIPPRGPLDAGWAFTYRRLVAETGDREMVDAMLRSVTFTARSHRASMAEVLDWIIATEALRDFVRGDAAAPPPVPEGPGGTLAAAFDRWIAAARLVRDDAPSAQVVDEEQLAMMAELAYAAGRYDDLARLLGSAPASETSIGLADDMARRLDRLCDSHLWHPGESMLLAGRPIFKFDPPAAPVRDSAPPQAPVTRTR